MKSVAIACVLFLGALPAAAQNQQRMTEEQLIEYLTAQRVCEDRRVSSARYINETGNRVTYTCDDATGFVPVVGLGLGGAGAAAAVAGLALAAAAAGGGGSTPDTQ